MQYSDKHNLNVQNGVKSNDLSPKVIKIEKEEIPQLCFPRSEVLKKKDDIIKRKNDLRLAARIGNLDKHKVKIEFEDANGIKIVETTIWSVGSENIVLKRSTIIPINRIHKIHF